jgi:hypothetical protein
MDKTRLGQTERGSYVLTVISPVRPPKQDLLVASVVPPPFERQVTTLVADGLNATLEASEYDAGGFLKHIDSKYPGD